MPDDSGGRETHFGPMNFGPIFFFPFEKFLGVIVFDGKIENFFITDSRSTSSDLCLSVGIFGISTSVSEVAVFF